MKFIENYKDGPYAVVALDKSELTDLRNRLDTNGNDIDLSDMFEEDDFKIESIKVVENWEDFYKKAQLPDQNVKWTTRIMWSLFVLMFVFSIYGVISLIKSIL